MKVIHISTLKEPTSIWGSVL